MIIVEERMAELKVHIGEETLLWHESEQLITPFEPR